MITALDHPLRHHVVNELHARPFPLAAVPCQVTYLAIKEPVDAANRPRENDHTHLQALLSQYSSPQPASEATHFFGRLGKRTLKWESHTEFVSYTAFNHQISARPFDPIEADVFPHAWLESGPGKRMVAISIRVEAMPEDESLVLEKLSDWFVGESLAVSRVIDGSAIIASDFRIDAAEQMRFAIFVAPGTGQRRVGRVIQRLCEIETYRAMSMLGLMRARKLGTRLNTLDQQLSTLVTELDHPGKSAEETLSSLLVISAELESQAVKYTFRFGATQAYEAIVNQRIAVMREISLGGRQTFAEFMMRRYDPAMRTVQSIEARLRHMAERAARAAELLRTRVDVERSAQNQNLLASMDKRAGQQLRLQRTVEGLSVVAISYYAINLIGYALYPLAQMAHIGKGMTYAILTPIVILILWMILRRMQRHL